MVRENVTIERKTLVQDPVCSMEVDRDEAAGTNTYRGEIYYFRSEDCKARFDEDPGRFAGQRGGVKPIGVVEVVEEEERLVRGEDRDGAGTDASPTNWPVPFQ